MLTAHTRETWHRSGHVTVRVYRAGRLWAVEHFPNLITSEGRNLMRDGLSGADDPELKYLAWGTGTAAPTVGDTQLAAEAGRKQITAQTPTGTGMLQTVVLLLATEANVNIRELGWFGGSAASATANSGRLASRVLYTRNKDNTEALQVVRDDEVT